MSPIPGLSGYVLVPLRESADFTLYRGRKHDDPSPVLAIALFEQPSPQSVRRLMHEYSFAAELDPAWAAKPLAITRHEGRTILLLKDPGGQPLDRILERDQGQPLDLTRFLSTAIGLARTLGQVHQQGLIHKDIKPANVLVDDTGNAWLTGFGIASQLPRERQSPQPPEFIAGTLAYMAPEQTGRMNRSIDSRSDLYSLGVTFYEMLTGSLPFTASDPMEWVHCHIAKQPATPSERVGTVPASVSAITMKLLSKTAEERYQTAVGVESDLRRCLSQWESQGWIDDFTPGAGDTPGRLTIPEKLYGRDLEVDTLLTAFDRIVGGGRAELVLVSGYSGIGKSAVVNELHKPLVPPRGLFASGKSDQYKRDIPHASLAQAFQSLIRGLLSQNEKDLRKWQDELREALGPNGLLLVDLVPELKHVIGEQPPVPELPPQEAQRRFQIAFRRFIGVFARPEHPLALFLDDMQWLDVATLDLLEDLLTRNDLQHLLLIGAYRDNEVNATHPLVRKLEAIRQAGAAVQDIVLTPLSRDDLGRLLVDSLHCQLERAAPLADLIHEKTTGNPFFAIQFISTLADDRLLTFDYRARRWVWDLLRIRAKGFTDNVVELMVEKLKRLPPETQEVLQQFACMGNSAEFEMLRMGYQGSVEDMHDHLWEAVRSGLIFRADNSYGFLHDRVQEAAYSLIPKELRAEAHLRIGMLLAEHTSAEKREEAIFEIVNQLNRGSHLITSVEDRERVAELNLIAGRRAKLSTAYDSALKYLRAGRALLAEKTCERNHQLIFSIEYLTAECELLTVTVGLAAGDPLAEVQKECENGLAFARRVRFGLVIERCGAQLGLILTLRGLTATFGCLDHDGYSELDTERRLANSPDLVLAEFYYWTRKLQAHFFAGDLASAVDASLHAEPLLWTSAAMFESAVYRFYGALAHAAVWDRATPEQRPTHFDYVLDHHRQLQVWAEVNPEIFEDLAALVGAEIARIEGRLVNARELYDKAIREAHKHGFVHNQALANEIAGRFYAERGYKKIAATYLRAAQACYQRWGADGKVRQLEELYPDLKVDKSIPDSTATIVTPIEQLDLATVIRVSEAVSGEIVLEKLIDTLMRTAIEHAGAGRGLLILAVGDGYRIEAEVTASNNTVTVGQRQESVTAADLPESILHYVIRTKESVLLHDAAAANPFSADKYINQHHARSILCLPLLKQGRLAGVLYLENNLTSHVFTPDRVTVLKVLVSQAAISLENSRLYRDVADREGKIRRLVDANIIGILIADREGRILEANDAFLRILRYDREDLVSGRVRWTELSPPEWRERDILTQAELNSTGVVQPFEKEYVRKDGSRVPVLVGAALFKEGGDRLAFVLDLTERKRVEEALSQAQRLSRTGNWIYDATTKRYLYWSDGSYRIWGFDPLQGLPSRQSMWERIHPEDRDKVWGAVQEAVHQKRDFMAEFRLLLPDGTIKWVEGTSYHVFSPQGTVSEVITTTVDVTERRRAQDEREKLRQLELDFAHMNRVSMMGELAASLSHEILHPIATARNNVRAGMRFLEMNPPNLDETREALACAVRDTDRARDIVGRMRDHIKKAPLRKERFDLNSATREVIVLAQSVIHRNGVSVQTRLADGLLPVMGDCVQLQQVLLNLILNAAEAMGSVEEGARELLISTERDQAGALVAVRDSGPGIDAQQLDRVFDAFYTTKSSGTGMGLSICRSIIHAHGGKLWAEANEPRGAVFQFTLPADSDS
ncbi:ATP-binding sensor histidine kinase [Bradyrhizobium lablabi]|uniref:ATP-binding sensor histidine kinase n=1 Tax=Bradyrhizobium lablabi TaxID=722472 RepID=UPI001BABDF8A|nr:ATP-binding sensor histidine kinase [Bradyrhizobium lablabi]MBR0697835.1 AAA family ATPase [Bradyrhizobium lablabi]